MNALKNTKVELSHESHTISEPKTKYKDWIKQKRRHLTTGKHYKFHHKSKNEMFQYIFFNPPFFEGTPKGVMDYAWVGRSVIKQFIKNCRNFLKPGGHVYVLLTTEANLPKFIEIINKYNFHGEIVKIKRLFMERAVIFKLIQKL